MTRAWLIPAAILVASLAGCTLLVPEAPVQPSQPTQVAQAPEEPALPIGQQQAVRKAESYLAFSAWSYKGLVEQLEFEGFTTADATFAVDYLQVDWNAQAAAKAASYLEFSSFSRQDLIDQLVFEGFTQAEAEFGVAAVGY